MCKHAPVILQWSYNPTTHTITSKMDGKCVDGLNSGGYGGTNVEVGNGMVKTLDLFNMCYTAMGL